MRMDASSIPFACMASIPQFQLGSRSPCFEAVMNACMKCSWTLELATGPRLTSGDGAGPEQVRSGGELACQRLE